MDNCYAPLFSALNTRLTATTVPVHDNPTQGDTSAAYIVIGDLDARDASNSCGDGRDILITTRGFTPDASRKASRDLAHTIEQALATPLTVAGFSVSQWTFDQTVFQAVEDGLRRQCLVQHSFTLRPEAGA